MKCPNCGKQTVFDWQHCPACGVDPWREPGEVLATTAPSERRESRARAATKRIVRFYAARPMLPRLLLLVGSAQVVFVLLANAGQYVATALHDGRIPGTFTWLYDVSVAITPGLLLLATGEALALLGRIAEGVRPS